MPIAYNGFTFEDKVTHTTGVSVQPQYDQAGRTVTANKYELSIETYLAAQPADAVVQNAVRRLSKPAGGLVFSGRGLPLSINVGRVKDISWGPKPLSVEVVPMGGGNASKLTWRVEFTIPDCADAIYQLGIAEFNFRLSFEIDRSGLTTRTYSGFVRVPMTRKQQGNRTLPDSVDFYREKINPALLPGFRRIPGTFTLNEAKDRLDFQIVDEQLPSTNVPPLGMVEAEASHRISAPPGKLYGPWQCTLTARYELGRGVATANDAARAFFALAKDRIAMATAHVGEKGRLTVFPISFDIEEPEIYGRPQWGATLVYQIMVASLKDILLASGQFRPAPGSNWRLWALSLANVLGARGHAQLGFRPDEDVIVDLCGSQKSTIELRGGKGREFVRELSGIPPGVFPAPTPATSWAHWECFLRAEIEQGTVESRSLPSAELTAGKDAAKPAPLAGGAAGGAGDLAAGAGWLANRIVGLAASAAAELATTTAGRIVPQTDGIRAKGGRLENEMGTAKVQQRLRPLVYLYLTGRAVRLGFPVDCPELVDVGGETPVACNRVDKGEGFWQGVVGNAGGPVYSGKWNLRYMLESIPVGPLPVPPNPLQGAA